MITLRYPLTLRECWAIIPWRNACRDSLRTVTADTRWSQFRFWLRVIRNPLRMHRYYAILADGALVGVAGLCNIERGQQAEISLIIDPARHGQGLGRLAVAALNQEARRLGLSVAWGEVYQSNRAVAFWQRLTETYGGTWTPGWGWRGKQVVRSVYFRWQV